MGSFQLTVSSNMYDGLNVLFHYSLYKVKCESNSSLLSYNIMKVELSDVNFKKVLSHTINQPLNPMDLILFYSTPLSDIDIVTHMTSWN